MLNIDVLTAFCQAAGAGIETDVPFSGLTTFKIGGPCAALITVPDAETCQKVFGYLRENQIPHDVIGRGSNLLVPDSGYAGAAIRLTASFISRGTRSSANACVKVTAAPMRI